VLFGLTESEQIEKLIDDYYDFIAEHLYSVKFVLAQVVRGDENSQEVVTRARTLYHVYRGLLTTILERGQTKHVFPPQVRPAEDAALIMATLNGLFVQHLVEQENTEHAQELLTRLKRAVRPTSTNPRHARTGLCLPSPTCTLGGSLPSVRAVDDEPLTCRLPLCYNLLRSPALAKEVVWSRKPSN